MNRRVLWIILVITFLNNLVDSASVSLTTSKAKVEWTTAKVNLISTAITNTTHLGSNGNHKMECKCVIFYECDQKDVVDPLTSGERECGETMVCCATSVLENLRPEVVPIRAPEVPLTPINWNLNPASQEVNETTDELCVCVPFYDCKPFQSEIIDPKTSECRSSTEVCCTRANLYEYINEFSTTSEPHEVIANTTHQGANGNPKLKCKCVLFYECASENVADTSTNGEGMQCEEDAGMVCCNVLDYEIAYSEPIPAVFTGTPNSALQSVNETTNESCICVAFYDCMLPPSNPINFTIPECESSTDVCCSRANLYPELFPSSTTPDSNSPTSSPESDICGRRKETIVGSAIVSPDDQWKTEFGEFPWMARILKTAAAPSFCEASIISPKIILTAAHCVSGKNISELKIRAGEYDIAEGAIREASYQEREVSSININPKYDSKTLTNDVALLSVTESFNFSNHIAPICIELMNSQWKTPNAYDPSSCLLTGWNQPASESNRHNAMKRAELSVLPGDQCLSGFVCTKETVISRKHMVNGGGPLVCASKNDRKRYIQVGILSWRSRVVDNIVFASLEANMEWITETYNVLTIFGV